MHLELQSGNDAEMPIRMAEYALGVYRRLRRFPRQIVLYVGEPALAMQPSLTGDRFSFSYELRDLRDRHNLAYLFISHDLKVVRALAHRVVVLRDGKIVEQGTADEIFSHPREEYTKSLMQAAFDLD